MEAKKAAWTARSRAESLAPRKAEHSAAQKADLRGNSKVVPKVTHWAAHSVVPWDGLTVDLTAASRVACLALRWVSHWERKTAGSRAEC